MPESDKPVTQKDLDATAARLRDDFNTKSGAVNKTFSLITAPLVDMLDTQKYRVGLQDIEKTVSSVVSDFASLNISSLIGDLVGGAAKVIHTIAQMDAEMRTNLEGQGSAYGELADSMRKQIGFIGSEVAEYGVTMQNTMDGVSKLTEASGKLALVGKETIIAGLEASAAYTKSNTFLLENVEKFRSVGLGLSDAAKAVNSIGQTSIGLGLNSKKVTDSLVTNLDKLNSYGFKNGVEGLARMVQQAQSLGLTIDKTLSIANDLFDPAKAIDMTANLQALGGAFGDFADPLKLMYDATNNVDGLQDSLAGAARNLATFNTEQGRFEVSGANLRRANDMAKALGMTTNDLTNMAVRAANKFEIMSKLDMFPSLKPEQKEFISNLATLKDGKVGFDIPDSMAEKLGMKAGFNTIEEMGSNIGKFQELQQKLAAEDPKEIARQQYNAVTNIMNTVNSIALKIGANAYSSKESENMQKAMSAISGALSEARSNPANKDKSISEIVKTDAEFRKKMTESGQAFKDAGAAMLSDIQKELGINNSTMNAITNVAGSIVNKGKEIYNKVEPKVASGYENIKNKVSEKASNFIQNVTGNITVTHNVTGLNLTPGSLGSHIINDPTVNAHIDTKIQQFDQTKQSGKDFTIKK